MVLEPKKDPTKQAHNAGFIIMDSNVEKNIKEWPDEWCVPLEEPLPEGKNEEDPPVHHVYGEENEVGDDQENQSQDRDEEDDNAGGGGSDHNDSKHTPSQKNIPTQHQKQQKGWEPLRKKRKSSKMSTRIP